MARLEVNEEEYVLTLNKKELMAIYQLTSLVSGTGPVREYSNNVYNLIEDAEIFTYEEWERCSDVYTGEINIIGLISEFKLDD